MTKARVQAAGNAIQARQYLDLTQTIMVSLDAGGGIVMMNRAGCALLGYTEEEILGRNWFETFLPQPEGRDTVLPVFRRIMSGELAAVEHFENEVVCRDGTKRLISWHNAEILDETGRIIGALSSGDDITDRRNADKELAESEERYRILSGAAFEAIAIHEEGVLLTANDQYFKMFGYEPGEMLGKQVMSVTVAPETLELTKQLVATGDLGPYESIGIRKDGTRFPIEIRARKMIYKGRHVRFTAIDDITGRKRATEALRRSESEFRNAFEHSAIGMALVSPEGKWLRVNRRVCDIVGYDRDELMRKTFQDITHPDDLNADLDFVRRMLAGEIETYEMEKRYFHRDGHIVWVLLAVSLVRDEHGAPLHFISQINDITPRMLAVDALKTSEERLRLANKATNDVVWDWDVIHDTQQWNEAGTVVFGWTEIVERPVNAHWWVERVHPDDRQRVHDSFFAVVDNPYLIFWHDEYRFIKADGAWADVMDRGYVLRDEQGKAVRMIGAMLDITERKQAEEALRKFAAELQRSNQELEQFAYIASHDLHEPLRKIMAFSERLSTLYDASLDEKGRDYLGRMQAAAVRMQHLIDDLLMLSRVMTRPRPHQAVDLADAAREALSDLDQCLEETGGQVTIRELPSVEADRSQMVQLFLNLIGNSLKFHQPGAAPRVVLDGAVTKQGAAEITVSDNGIGFDEKYLDRIFLPFQRLHTRTEYEGTGMGLAVCGKIVQRHGGSITAASKPGQGAVFTIVLPRKREMIQA